MTTRSINNNIILQQNELLPQFTLDEYRAESDYFNEYDQGMVEAVDDQEQETDSLLQLIVNVQSYMAETPADSALISLQYKMYTYLKQRAFEMEMQVPPFL